MALWPFAVEARIPTFAMRNDINYQTYLKYEIKP